MSIAKRSQAKYRQKISSDVHGPTQQQISELVASFNCANFQLALEQAKTLTIKHPKHPFGWKALGALLKRIGKLDESLDPMLQSVRLAPNDAEAQSNLGVTFKELGRLTEAVTCYQEAIRIKPDYPEAHNNLGNTLKSQGKLIEAERCFQQAILLRPNYAEAYSNLGNLLNELGRPLEAEVNCRESIRINPTDAEAYNNLGNALNNLGRLVDAEFCYREAIRLKPNFAIAHCNRGVVLNELGRQIEAQLCCREAIRLQPTFAKAYSNLGNILTELGAPTEAKACCKEAIKLKPDLAEAFNNLANAFKDLGQLREAEGSYREAIRLKPDYAEAHSNLLFSLNYVESLTPDAARVEAENYGAQISSRALAKFTSWSIDAQASKLRVGFVSGDFRNHPVGYFVEGLLKNLDRNLFEVYAFPTVPKVDDLTDRIKPYFKSWLPIYGKADLEAANYIHAQGIHVLVDLSGHTAHNRLPVFAYKPAPIQISWLGYFATTGLPEMDYVLGDPVMSPSNERHHFTEKVWNLPETWLCLTPPSQTIPIFSLPAKSNGHITFGCLGNLSKINDQVIILWAKILNRVAGSKLFLKTKQFADTQVVSFVQNQFLAHGVTKERLILEGPSSRASYFEAYNRVDLVLDTFPYPGGTTSVDALWMGVPVLTLKGDRFLSHLGESIATNAGLQEWISQDQEDYVRKAEAFALDLKYLEQLRSGLRAQVLESALFDTHRFASNFGVAIQEICNSHKP